MAFLIVSVNTDIRSRCLDQDCSETNGRLVGRSDWHAKIRYTQAFLHKVIFNGSLSVKGARKVIRYGSRDL